MTEATSRSCGRLLLAALALLLPSLALAEVSITSTDTPYPGITIERGQLVSPERGFWAARVELCADYVHVTATEPSTVGQTTGGWASSVGVQVAVNGDFYDTRSLRLWGDAIGNGVAWPDTLTGANFDFAGYGWMSVGPNGVDFTHTKWVKNHASQFEAAGYSVSAGFEPGLYSRNLPEGAFALVSGGPELVIEGRLYTCPDPGSPIPDGAPPCFPDRNDMSAPHIRSAMGFTEDRQQIIFVATTSPCTGVELAQIVYDLGAWQAFNLDGGGSSALWTEASGYLRSSSRAVVNHWGVFAGTGSGRPQTPSSCCVRETEACDGMDNDCDGAVDEDLTRDCGVDVGECRLGLETCEGGAWGACSEPPAGVEACNGLDDDCDGTVDEDGVCGRADAGELDGGADPGAADAGDGGDDPAGGCGCRVAADDGLAALPIGVLVPLLVVRRWRRRSRRPSGRT